MTFAGKNDGGTWIDEAGTPRSAGFSISKMDAADRAALDAANSGYTSAAAYVVGTVRTPGRGILALIATAGNAIFTFGGIDITVPLVVGPTILPLAVTKVAMPGSGAAVGTYYAIS